MSVARRSWCGAPGTGEELTAQRCNRLFPELRVWVWERCGEAWAQAGAPHRGAGDELCEPETAVLQQTLKEERADQIEAAPGRCPVARRCVHEERGDQNDELSRHTFEESLSLLSVRLARVEQKPTGARGAGGEGTLEPVEGGDGGRHDEGNAGGGESGGEARRAAPRVPHAVEDAVGEELVHLLRRVTAPLQGMARGVVTGWHQRVSRRR